MHVHYDLGQLPDFRNAVITIGSFDGVHSGHQQILARVIQTAREKEGESIVITFHPHPRLVLHPNGDGLQLITTVEEKIQLLGGYGIDHVVVVPFTVEFSRQSPDAYIADFLYGKFHPSCIVIGYDHRFGLNRQGDIQYLRKSAAKSGFEVVEIPKQEVEDIAVSSTKIRKALEKGAMRQAGRLLNHPFTITGTVVRGQQIGSKIGFPTANIDPGNPHKLIPPHGVYAVRVMHKDQIYSGMLYIGDRPTLPELPQRNIEVHIFDFDRDIYGDKIRLELIERLRGDMVFEGLEPLRQQLMIDRETARAVLARKPGSEQESRHAIPKVSVAMLNYNTRELLEEMIPRVLETNYENLELIVIDNGSTDGSSGFLQGRYPNVRCITLEKNYGFAEGYNRGLKGIQTDYLVLLNTDVLVDPNWIAPLIELMEQNSEIAVAMPKILDYRSRDHFEYAGAAGGWIDYLGYPFCRGRIFNSVEKDDGQYDSTQEIFWASGAAFFIRPRLFKELGGFDGSYFAHLEEIDLCWKLKRAGYRIVCVPAAKVYHIGGGTLEYQNSRKTYLNFRNSLFTILKNESPGKLLWLIPLRLILDGIAGIQFLLSGKSSHLRAILKAHFHFYRSFGSYRRQRSVIQEQIQKISIHPEMNKKGMYPKSIVWQHFVRGRKFFKNLP